MQAKSGLPGGRELLCINTEKVYDWVLNEATFDVTFRDIMLPEDGEEGLNCDDFDIEDVTCEVTPLGFDVLSRHNREFVFGRKEVTLQLVKIRKKFKVTFNFPTASGTKSVSREKSRTEHVILCAPDDTDIKVKVTDVDCMIVDFDCDTDYDTFDAVVNVRICQSIQSVFKVTLELEAEFCHPRDILPIPGTACPTPTIPPQCPVLFPDDDCDDDDGHGKE